MKKGIMALEGLEVQTPDIGDDVTDGPSLVSEVPVVIDESVADIASQCEQINEAEQIGATVDQIADTMEASVARGEGLDEPAAQIANAALENFYSRLEYKRKGGQTTIGLEGFDNGLTRFEKTKVALEELKDFRTRLAARIALAQEGLETAVDEHIEATGEDVEKVQALLDKTSKAFEDKGGKKDVIEGGRWAESLGTFTTEEGAMVLPADVLKRVEEIQAAVDGAKLSETVKEESKLEDKLAKLKEVAAAVKKVTGEPGADDVKFAAVTEGEKDAIVNAAKAIAAELAAFATGWDNLEEPKEAPKEIPKEGETAEEAPATKTDNSALQELVELNAELTKLCYAVNEYVEKSTA